MALFAPASFLDLSDDVLLLIFSYLQAWDLMHIAETCERFSKVARDKSLWTDVDFSSGCLSLQRLRRELTFLRPTTRRLVLRGFKKRFAGSPRWKTPLVSTSFLKNLGEKCQDLEELTICEAHIDTKKLKMIDFLPVKSIKSLSFMDCEFVNLPSPLTEGSYFKRTHKILTNLEELRITKCSWIDDYDVMVLSKIDTLKTLVLRNLPKVGRAMAYIALGFRFGFQNLEELDLRGTSLEDNEVLSVVQNGKLRSLYLGPMGPVKRLPLETSRGHNLVMPDPRWQEERHQVVVINVGPNGPRWRQVNDEELDDLGLQWVRNAPVVQRYRAEEEDEDRHYFIGRDGRPVEHEESNEVRAVDEDENDEDNDNVSHNEKHNVDGDSARKQPAIPNAESTGSDQKGEGTPKQQSGAPKASTKVQEDEGKSDSQKPEEEVGDNEEEEEEEDGDEDVEDLHDEYQGLDYNAEETPQHEYEAYQPPDEYLSDNLVRAFGQNTQSLHKLVLSGCAISDNGLQNIIRSVPSLRYLDVTNTKVTSAGIQEARVTRPGCVILGGGTRIVRQNDR